MDILVEVSKNRKCPASLDWQGDHWILSFGDLNKPNTDVEIEMAPKQLAELHSTIHSAEAELHRRIEAEREAREKAKKAKDKAPTIHVGSC